MDTFNEEAQIESVKSFAKKYGSTITSGVLVALVAFFGWQYWQNKKAAESQIRTAKVQQLMTEAQAAVSNPTAFSALSASADKLVKDAPDSVQAIQTQLLMAKLHYEKGDYAAAEKVLNTVENSKLDDAGLLQVVKLRLAYAQSAQKKYAEALKTLAGVTDASFKATADEARGDVYVAQNNIAEAKKAYQSAWNLLLERKQERQILQIKLESVGVLVEDPKFERPVLETPVDES